MQREENLMELVGKMDTSILSPMEDTIEQLGQAWEDPAGKAFVDRLRFHRDQIVEARKKIADTARKQ